MAKEHVHDVFQSVAEQYDAANNRISLGMHHGWKRALVDAAMSVIPTNGSVGKVLDVCCGTGDITQRIAEAHPDCMCVGLDFSSEMLKVAETRVGSLDNVMLVEGNAMELPFEDNYFDAAVISFGLRNTPDYVTVLSEMKRVVRPGGIVACLDASVPDNRLIFPFYRVYYQAAMPFLGGGISKHKEYVWLYQSTQDFPRKAVLKELFWQAGLVQIEVRSFCMGAAALHTGRVPA